MNIDSAVYVSRSRGASAKRKPAYNFPHERSHPRTVAHSVERFVPPSAYGGDVRIAVRRLGDSPARKIRDDPPAAVDRHSGRLRSAAGPRLVGAARHSVATGLRIYSDSSPC